MPRAIETRDALEMRASGMSYRKIAAALGEPLQTVYDRVRREIANIPKEAADDLRSIEQERLDRSLDRLEEAARAGDVRAIAEQRLIGESRRRLFGLDAPTKSDARVTVEIPEDVEALRARLVKILEGEHAEAAADRHPGDGAGGPAADPGLVGPDESQRGPVDPDPNA